MLVAGSTSSCDVCLEPFGRDNKVPCSISCGHVFCVECLDNISPPTCPMCRKAFDPFFTVRLHIDLDNVKGPSSPRNATVTASDEQDAKRLYQAITKIATEGCSESHIRGVISEGKTFLAHQPRESFKDLRTIYRLMSYLTEVKSNLRACKQQNEIFRREHKALTEERDTWAKKVQREVKKREQEQKQALEIELNLRDHCTKAHEAYERMVEQYNYVAKEWSRMNDEIKRLRTLKTQERAPGSPNASPEHYSPCELDQDSLLGAALREGNSILISPLPEFTTKNATFKPLPRVEEGDEEEEDSYDGSEEYDESEEEEEDALPAPPPASELLKPGLATSSTLRHVPSDELAKRSQSSERASPERFTAIDQPSSTPMKEYFQVPNPSGLSRTAPYAEAHRRSRSHSIPSDSSNRTPSSSRPSSRSVSPARPSASSSRTRLPAQPSQSPHLPYEIPAQSSSRSPIPQGSTDNDGLRSRLQTILGDASSSSPPQSSASMAAARAERRRSASRSRSPPPVEHRRQPSQARSPHDQQPINSVDQIARLLQSNAPSGSGAPPSTSPNPRTSSASEAARALERSKRERREREQRLATERSSPEREIEPHYRGIHPPMLPQTYVSASSMAAASTSQARYVSASSGSPPRSAPISSGQQPQPQQTLHPHHQPYQLYPPRASSSNAKPYAPNHPTYTNQPGLYA